MIENFNIQKILNIALKNGGEFAELYEEHSHSTQIIRESKRLDRIVHHRDAGVGLRILYQGKSAYGSTNEITEKALLQLAEQLASALTRQGQQKNIFLRPTVAPWQPSLEKPPSTVSLEEKARWVLEADQAAWGVSPHVRQVTAIYREMQKTVTVANSLGELAKDQRNYLIFVAQVVAEKDGVLQTGYEPLGGTQGLEIFDNDAALQTAQVAAKRAVRMLSAPLAPSGSMPVIVAAEAGGTLIHEAVGHGLEADLACEGLSVYQNCLGETVANPLITVIDDPTLPGKRGSFVFDDEGTPARRNVLIEKGVLKSYMYDRRYAMKEEVHSTGNGRRESYRHQPLCRMTNTLIAPGTSDPETILRSVPDGLLVLRMGSGQVNTVNGDFVFEVSEGYRLRHGQIDHPVRGATLTGNGPAVLKSIDQVGSDLGFGLGTCGKDGQGVPVGDAQPTLRIPEIIVGGH